MSDFTVATPITQQGMKVLKACEFPHALHASAFMLRVCYMCPHDDTELFY